MATRASLYRYRLPLTAPLVLARSTLTHRSGCLLRLEDEMGRVRWGEAAPLPGFSRESLHQVEAALKAVVQQINASDVEGDFSDVVHLPSVRMALDMVRASSILGENTAGVNHCRGTVSLNALLLADDDGFILRAQRLVEEGYKVLKLKVGRRPVAQDVLRIRGVVDALGGQASLRLDANRAWTWEEAIQFCRAIDGFPVEYLEEPLRGPAELPALADVVSVPLALDETLLGLPAGGLRSFRGMRAVVLKPTLLGGLVRCRDLAAEAAHLGMVATVSAAFESGICLRALLLLAASLGQRPVAAGLDTYRRLREDVSAPRLPLDRPLVRLEEAQGLSITLNPNLTTRMA